MTNICQPTKIICVGLNYFGHAKETGAEVPKEPVIFGKFNDTLMPHMADIELPPQHRCYDYEAELVIVIGREAWNIKCEEAHDYIYGYTCGNDLSARDCQFRSSQWLIGKSLPGSAPAGPVIVPASMFKPEDGHRITCRVNGAITQDGNTADMIFTCDEIVSYCSQFFRLQPWDLIFTGTPAGVILGKPKEERVWLKKGDTVEVTIDGIGTLTNRLI
jgi:2-keto-4-pentenoate hydratase/2-oxohepta-3-ene-1,7-dioic acid hydratase in catechol pathway